MEGPDSQGVELNSSVNLTCVFKAGYDISGMVQWRRGDENVTDGASTVVTGNMTYTSTLVIESVTFGDCGSYTCSVGVVSSPPAELGVYGEVFPLHLPIYLASLPSLTHSLPLSSRYQYL